MINDTRLEVELLKRFIRYLYEYGQGKRVRNVGFVKVEQTQDDCSVQIHGKGLHMEGEDSLALGLFLVEGGTCIVIPLAEINNVNPAVNYSLNYTPGDTGMPENFERIGGVIMESPDGRKFAALWEDVPVDIEHPQMWREETEETVETVEREETVETVETVKNEEPGQESPEKEEVEASEEPRKRERPWKITKIQRREITLLPRCEWQAANNQFLLHGYYNYRHLVLIDNGTMLKLGVPVIYHEKEAKAAESFGFPEFIGLDETGLTLSPEECDDNRQFGYWCRQVRHPLM